MTTADLAGFQTVLEFIEKNTGIRLPESHYRQVKCYLAEKAAGLKVGIDQFLDILGEDTKEREAFLDTVTINETYFFREERHYSVLEDHIFPSLDKNPIRPLQFWSAACSTGEEPLSLAALAADFWPLDNFRVFASDINSSSLEHLRRGVYGKNSFRNDGKRYHSRLGGYAEQRNGATVISGNLLDTISIVPLNLSDLGYSAIPSGIHVIFLRNMLIYTRFELRVRILDSITAKLAEGGYLFLSASEVPLLAHTELVLENHKGCYYFRKKTLEEKNKGITPGISVLKKSGEPVDHTASTEETPARKPTPAEILRHVGRRLNNPVYEAPDDEAFIAALDYLESVYFLNSGDLDSAQKSIDELTVKWGENEITDYLRGLEALRNENETSAEKWFSEAVTKNPGFWPAIFQRALLIRRREPHKAAREFAAALRSINTYIKRGAFYYQFLLEGFNARYFEGMCRGWIEKLRSKGAAHGA